MTITDAGSLMELLITAYPQFYKNFNSQEKSKAIKLWAVMFDEPLDIILMATKAFISSDNQGFPPVIGQIKDKIRLLTEKKEIGELEAWGLVINAINIINSYACFNDLVKHTAQIEFKKLPKLIQKVLGTHQMLLEWRQGYTEFSQSHFIREYRNTVAKQKEIDMLPKDIKQLVQQENFKRLQ